MRPAAERIVRLGRQAMQAVLMAGVTTLAIAPALASDRPLATAQAEAYAADPISAFYAARAGRLAWYQGGALNERGRLVASTLSSAANDGLDPAAYLPAGVTRPVATLAEAARLDRALSRGLAAYARDLRGHAPPTGAFVYTDPQFPPQAVDGVAALEQVADGPSAQAALDALRPANPIYVGLRTALGRHRHDASPSGGKLEPLILLNMDRARSLPDRFGDRYVWVDIPAARLTAFDHGAPQVTMPVVVGKREQQTPAMVGRLRYAVVNPYWNRPEDRVRTSIAPKVLKQGPSYLEDQGIEILSDWSDAARPVAPTEIAWSDVASGAVSLRARQRPGPANMMGAVKLMAPNAMGIYLHDTPFRDLFANSARTFSSGCVRLQDAVRLSRWLLGHDLPAAAGPETQVALPAPTPLYLTYFTVLPAQNGELTLRGDLYGLDKAGTAPAPKLASGPARIRAVKDI
jgi:murein L,D-transpeptidase YcbB/YkuD